MLSVFGYQQSDVFVCCRSITVCTLALSIANEQKMKTSRREKTVCLVQYMGTGKNIKWPDLVADVYPLKGLRPTQESSFERSHIMIGGAKIAGECNDGQVHAAKVKSSYIGILNYSDYFGRGIF
jgi:hypothetical protein